MAEGNDNVTFRCRQNRNPRLDAGVKEVIEVMMGSVLE
jgi:hypothetical protein